MGPTGVVEADPLSDDTRGVLLGFEAMTMHALLFQRPDDALDHAVLLWTMRRDELLPETITTHEARVGPRGKNEPIVRPQKERGCDTSERPEPCDQRLFERRHRRGRCTNWVVDVGSTAGHEPVWYGISRRSHDVDYSFGVDARGRAQQYPWASLD